MVIRMIVVMRIRRLAGCFYRDQFPHDDDDPDEDGDEDDSDCDDGDDCDDGSKDEDDRDVDCDDGDCDDEDDREVYSDDRNCDDGDRDDGNEDFEDPAPCVLLYCNQYSDLGQNFIFAVKILLSVVCLRDPKKKVNTTKLIVGM